MFLKHFLFINWGNIPTIDFELGPVNLFSGGNGSGKTTAADAIQTIMTAAHENLFQYNPGQDETTQRGRGGKRVRTLASYVLGCDDGSFARLRPTDGYLAAVFHPTQGETAAPFTALIGVRAWLDTSGAATVARQDDAQFFVLPEVQLEMSHLVQGEGDERRVIGLDRLQKNLIAAFGKTAVEKYDSKRGYLRRLYGVLRGRDDAAPEAEAMAAARAFSRFMAYKPVRGINRFVADEILEQRDLGEAIRSVSSQLKTIHAMEGEAARLVESIEVLDGARAQAGRYIEQWIELNTLDYTLAQHDYAERQQAYLKKKRGHERERMALTEAEEALAVAERRAHQLHDQLVSLEAQRMGVDALRQKDELEQRRGSGEGELVETARRLLEQSAQLDTNLEQTRRIVGLLPEAGFAADLPLLADLHTLSQGRKLVDKGRGGAVDFQGLMQRDLTGDLAPLEKHLDEAREQQRLHNQWRDLWHGRDLPGGLSLRDQLARLVHQREARHDQLQSQRRQKALEIERLEARQVSYPPHVERALDAIRRQCPAADPRVLCDHVEVKDPEWQAAVEGYLGGARFSILVAPEHEAEAIRIVRGLPGRDNKARVIQGEKALRDAERMDLHRDSIIQILDFSHAAARAYLAASYGSVLRVDSAEALRRTRRGLTTDGMASGNYSMWRCDLGDGELVFGLAARERALRAKEAELARIDGEWQEAADRLRQAAELLAAVDALQPLGYADTLARVLEIHRELRKLEGLIAQLDLGEHAELERQLAALKAQERELHAQQSDLNQRIGQLQNRIAVLDAEARALSDQQAANRAQVERHEADLRAIAAAWTAFDVDARLDAAHREAKGLNREIAENFRREAEGQLHAAERRMGEAIQRHNQQCRPGDAIPYSGYDGQYDAELFRAVCGLQRDIDRVYNVLKNNILVEKREALRTLKESFNHAFVSHLCHAIYQAINDGKRQIELLNRELQHHRFGSDRETFRFASEWVPEFRDYARFFEEVVKNPVLGDDVTLFEAELSARSQRVRDRLMEMLLDEDSQRALRELERIADYRNYRRYEIYKEVEGKAPIPLSEYGTGSGGQLETPAYIIRSAAITSAFRFAEGQNHLRLVLVDEAFSKMDETRSREVIRYLTETLGLQLVFIMPTNKCGPYMDLISNEFVFAKVPSATPRGQLNTRVLVDRKACNQQKIQDLWAQHRQAIYQQAELDFMEEFV